MGLVYEEVGVRAPRVGDVMSTRVVAVTPGTPFRDVVELMLRHEISTVPLVDDVYGLVDLISEADLISEQAYGGRRQPVLDGFSGLVRQEARELTRSRGRTAREIMSAPVETALVDDPLRAIARRMVENRLKHLVVVDGSRRLVGLVSRRDLLRAFDRSDTEIATEVAAALATSEFRQGDDAVSGTVEGGIVTLEGRVRRRDDIAAVCRLARRVPGVIDVANHLVLGTPPPPGVPDVAAEASTVSPGPDTAR
jgi:CBS domain-containing protein